MKAEKGKKAKKKKIPLKNQSLLSSLANKFDHYGTSYWDFWLYELSQDAFCLKWSDQHSKKKTGKQSILSNSAYSNL